MLVRKVFMINKSTSLHPIVRCKGKQACSWRLFQGSYSVIRIIGRWYADTDWMDEDNSALESILAVFQMPQERNCLHLVIRGHRPLNLFQGDNAEASQADHLRTRATSEEVGPRLLTTVYF